MYISTVVAFGSESRFYLCNSFKPIHGGLGCCPFCSAVVYSLCVVASIVCGVKC